MVQEKTQGEADYYEASITTAGIFRLQIKICYEAHVTIDQFHLRISPKQTAPKQTSVCLTIAFQSPIFHQCCH